MPKLIFLTGFMGSGKSYAAEQFEDRALLLNGDHLFSTSHRTLRPEIPEASNEANDWDGWPRDKRDAETLRHVFTVSPPKADSRILGYRGNVIADGAIFVYDWFRMPLIDALRAIQPLEEVHLLYLSLTDRELFESIRSRGKGSQFKKYDTVEKVAADNEGFRRKFGSSRDQWETFTDRAAVAGRLKRVLD